MVAVAVAVVAESVLSQEEHTNVELSIFTTSTHCFNCLSISEYI